MNDNIEIISESISIKDLVDAGAHFGHRVRYSDPRMKPYLYGQVNGVHLIDLRKTIGKLKETATFLSGIVAKRGKILFVCTKKITKDYVEEIAKKCDISYVNSRWIGGTLTNFKMIRFSIKKYNNMIDKMNNSDYISKMSKKEQKNMSDEINRLEKFFGGMVNMHRIPDVIIIVDPKKEHTAVLEANILGVPVIAISDSNCDPTKIGYIIPGNDDSGKAIRLYIDYLSSIILQTKESIKEKMKLENEKIDAEGGIDRDKRDKDTDQKRSENDEEQRRRQRRTRFRDGDSNGRGLDRRDRGDNADRRYNDRPNRSNGSRFRPQRRFGDKPEHDINESEPRLSSNNIITESVKKEVIKDSVKEPPTKEFIKEREKVRKSPDMDLLKSTTDYSIKEMDPMSKTNVNVNKRTKEIKSDSVEKKDE